MKRVVFLTTDFLGDRVYSINSHLMLMLYVLKDMLKDAQVYIVTSNINSKPVYSYQQIKEQHAVPDPCLNLEIKTIDYHQYYEAAKFLCTCDLVFSQMYIWAPSINLAKKTKPNIKVIYWIHSLLIQEMLCNRHSKWVGYELYEKMQQDLIAKADSIILDSKYDCNLCDRFYNSLSKSNIIYPVPIPYISKCSPNVSTTKNITFLGRWEYRKGMEFLIRAFFKLYTEEENVKLTMLSDMNYIGNYENVFSDRVVLHMFKCMMEKGAINLVSWINLRTNYIDFVKRETAVAVLPSLYDPFNIIAYDCVVNGIPLVLSNFCGAMEIIKDFSNIEKINPFNSLQIYESIKKLFNCNGEPSIAGVDRCSYNIDNFQHDLIDVIQNTIKNE